MTHPVIQIQKAIAQRDKNLLSDIVKCTKNVERITYHVRDSKWMTKTKFVEDQNLGPASSSSKVSYLKKKTNKKRYVFKVKCVDEWYLGNGSSSEESSSSSEESDTDYNKEDLSDLEWLVMSLMEFGHCQLALDVALGQTNLNVMIFGINRLLNKVLVDPVVCLSVVKKCVKENWKVCRG